MMLNESYYTRAFSIFDANSGKFRWTWNWAAFLFGGLWQIFRGLYLKFFLYGLAIYFLEWLGWMVFGVGASWIYPLIFLGCLFVYGFVGNYDLYLKKIRGEHLWPVFSFRDWRVKIFIILLIGTGAFVFVRELSDNALKGFRESRQLIQTIDQAIEEQLSVDCEIFWEVHLHPIRNLYDLDVRLDLPREQSFNFQAHQQIEEIVKEKLAPFGELGQLNTGIRYKDNSNT